MALADPSHGAVLLDTQALIRWDGGGDKLGRRSRRMIDGKIMLRENAARWREELLGGGLNEIPGFTTFKQLFVDLIGRGGREKTQENNSLRRERRVSGVCYTEI